jgi:hypothetical protein
MNTDSDITSRISTDSFDTRMSHLTRLVQVATAANTTGTLVSAGNVTDKDMEATKDQTATSVATVTLDLLA